MFVERPLVYTLKREALRPTLVVLGCWIVKARVAGERPCENSAVPPRLGSA